MGVGVLPYPGGPEDTVAAYRNTRRPTVGLGPVRDLDRALPGNVAREQGSSPKVECGRMISNRARVVVEPVYRNRGA